MDNGYLSLFGALPDLIAIARRRALLRLSAAFIVIALVVAVAYFALDFYQLWQVWPILWRPSLTFSFTAALSYATLQLSGVFLLSALEFVTLNGPTLTIGAFGRPRPTLMFAQALLAAIVARDPAVAPTMDADQTANETTDEPATRVIERLAHPAGVIASKEQHHWVGGGIGLTLIGLAIFLILLSFHLMLATPDPAVAALHIPFLTWLSPYRFVIEIDAIAYVFIFGGCFAIVWMLIALRYAHITQRGMTAQVGANEIRAQFPGARGIEWATRWADVRGFARLRYRDSWLHDHEIYLLLAGARVLLWEKQPVTQYAKPEVTAHVAATRDAADQLVAAVKRYVPDPLVEVSEFLTASNRGLTGVNPHMNWNLLDIAELIARSENDQPLWRELWEKRHPGKSAPQMPGRWIASIFTDSLPQAAREDMRRAAKALLPYYPTPEVVRANLRTRFLSRGYVRFTFTVAALALTWALLTLVFVIFL